MDERRSEAVRSDPQEGSDVDRAESGAPAAGQAVHDIFSTDEIFQRITATADEEFDRSNRMLFLSGIAAGFSIGVSFLARAALTGQVEGGGAVLGNLFYPVGFLLIVLGRYQLFTENTLTPVTLVLTRIASVPILLRLWGVVLAANLIGVGLFAYVLSFSDVLPPTAREAALGFGEHALALPATALFWKGLIAGFIVASMVWLIHAVRDNASRVLVVFFLMMLIPTADLFHCIVGAGEALFMVFVGEATVGAASRFFLPVLLGNTVGGVLLVAVLNHSQTRDQRYPDRDCGELELSWNEWLFGIHAGSPGGTFASAPAEDAFLADPPGEDDHGRGEPDASDTLVMYGDHACPHTREAHRQIEELLDGERPLRFVYRHYPLRRRHPRAEPAARASEAAAAQDRFWEMHERLLADSADLDDDGLRRCAEEAGLDMERFERDLASDAVRRRVQRDVDSGGDSGVTGTPTIFLNGARYREPLAWRSLERAGARGEHGGRGERSAEGAEAPA